MSLFQSAVLNKYLKQQDGARIAAAYAAFTKHFHDPAVQANIRDAKEEQYQEGFLRDLFVSVLGYTLNPQAGYDLTSELKNEKGSKKADGAGCRRPWRCCPVPGRCCVAQPRSPGW
jgi:hypothetical protein